MADQPAQNASDRLAVHDNTLARLLIGNHLDCEAQPNPREFTDPQGAIWVR